MFSPSSSFQKRPIQAQTSALVDEEIGKEGDADELEDVVRASAAGEAAEEGPEDAVRGLVDHLESAVLQLTDSALKPQNLGPEVTQTSASRKRRSSLLMPSEEPAQRGPFLKPETAESSTKCKNAGLQNSFAHCNQQDAQDNPHGHRRKMNPKPPSPLVQRMG